LRPELKVRADEDIEKRREIDTPACQPGDELPLGQIDTGVVPRRAICGQFYEVVGGESAVGISRGDPARERTDIGDVRIRSLPRVAGRGSAEEACPGRFCEP